MEATVVRTGTEGKTWGGGSKSPLKASYGKMMMWIFYHFRCFNISTIS